MSVTDRPLPSSPDAERAVLGSVLLSGVPCFIRLPQALADNDFGNQNAPIFAAMAWLHEERQPIDVLGVVHLLRSRKRGESTELEAIGGAAYISSLTDDVPDIANVESYAGIVIEMAQKRRLMALGEAIVREAADGGTLAEDVAAGALARLGPFATRESEQARSLIEVLSDACAAQERRRRGEQDSIALRSSYAQLGGMRALKRSFVILGSPSEHGKTAATVAFSDDLASHDQAGAVFTLENTEEEWALRYASQHGGIPHGLMQDWRLMNDGNFARLAEVKGAAAKAHLFLTRRVRSIEGIALECQRLRATEKIDFAMIDYIQLVRMTRNPPRDREERLAEIAQSLLQLSLELGIMILATSQVTEEWRKRESGRLIKEDLKYARALAETARVVMLFHRPRVADKTNDKYPWCEGLLQVEKNNENRTDDVRVHFDEITQQLNEGDCEENNCRTLKNRQPLQQALM